MITNIAVILLAITVILQGVAIRRQEERINILADSLKLVDDILGRHSMKMDVIEDQLTDKLAALRDNLEAAEDRLKSYSNRFGAQIRLLESKLEKAEDLIDAHAELEKEAAKSEQLFQEGLTNLLSYGVTKHE